MPGGVTGLHDWYRILHHELGALGAREYGPDKDYWRCGRCGIVAMCMPDERPGRIMDEMHNCVVRQVLGE